MKSTALVICLLAAASTPQNVTAGVLHGPVTNAANNHLYYLLTQANWTASEAEAVQMGGHLATINDEAESLWLTLTFGESGEVSRGLWIGLNDVAEEGTFTWASGETPAFEFWRPQFPLDPDGSWDYVHIEWPSSIYVGRWRTAPNSSDYSGLPVHGVVEVASPAPSVAIHTAVEIVWPSQTNKFYQVQWTAGSSSTNWQNLGPAIPGNGTNNSAFDSTRTAQQRFYRVTETAIAAE